MFRWAKWDTWNWNCRGCTRLGTFLPTFRICWFVAGMKFDASRTIFISVDVGHQCTWSISCRATKTFAISTTKSLCRRERMHSVRTSVRPDSTVDILGFKSTVRRREEFCFPFGHRTTQTIRHASLTSTKCAWREKAKTSAWANSVTKDPVDNRSSATTGNRKRNTNFSSTPRHPVITTAAHNSPPGSGYRNETTGFW